jgi:hypothetical protein
VLTGRDREREVLNIQLEQILLQCRQTCRHDDVEKMGYMFRRPVHGSAGVDIGESENDDREECRRPI